MRVDFTTFGVDPPENGKNGRAGQTAGAKGTSNTSASTSASTSGSTAGADQTRFAFDRTRVQSLEAQVLAQPEIRQAKVQALQQAIGKGEYSVPPDRVANAVINEWAVQ